jgi:hypothetical protein
MRTMHVILLAAIFGYAYVAEMMLNPTTVVSLLIVKSFSILAIVDGIIAFVIRRRLLRKAMDGLQRDPGDAAALAQWRKANVFAMVMAVSVSLYGFALRFMGVSRLVAAPLFVGAIILMWLWRPRLDEGIGGANTSPPPLG